MRVRLAGCRGPADRRQRSVIRTDGLILHAVLMFRTVELLEPSDVRWRRILIRLKNSWRVQMAAIVRALSHTFPDIRGVDVEILKTVAKFCAAALTAPLLAVTLAATYGLDLSPGFF
jgi:hypothetical protein